jgi:hypothetical protein
MAVVKDKEVYLFNVFTGNLDLALKFNENRIVTHQYNAAGDLLKTYDTRSAMQIDLGFLVVTDNDGNVVVL